MKNTLKALEGKMPMSPSDGIFSVDGSIEDDLPEGLKGWKEPAKEDKKEEKK